MSIFPVFQSEQALKASNGISRAPGDSLNVVMLSDPPGELSVPALSRTSVCIHVGPSSRVACRRDGKSHRGVAVHGDIDIVPSGVPCVWELKDTDTILALSISTKLVQRVTEELELDPRRLEVLNRYQTRDPQLEHIGWALKAEMELDYPGGRLYLDSLATALATHLIRHHSNLATESPLPRGGFPGHKLKRVLSFIEDHLGDDLALADVAEIAGMSVSHCKALFRQALGVPIHQYVIRRRVDRAATLLREGKLPISRVALETGFSHQSHLALHLRRVLGASPKELRRESAKR
ncbi:MAG TPA: AraC family transcriptional regulator [Candidatus Angelobacter sp.]|nr:AraC family transcriptional regulator [Candidatus Angelobacter sp.]